VTSVREHSPTPLRAARRPGWGVVAGAAAATLSLLAVPLASPADASPAAAVPAAVPLATVRTAVPALVAVPAVPVGVAPGGGFAAMSPALMRRELTAYANNGVRWLRLDVPWAAIEARRGHDVWVNVDRVVATARARRMSVMIVLAYTPAWARRGGSDITPPTRAADFGAFAGRAAAHFRGRVAAYEIWNEPNISDAWAPRPNPAGYVGLLRAAYPRIKAADPSATVVAGAMSPAVDSRTTISPNSFATAIYRFGGRPFFDALSLHPYGFPALPSDRRTKGWNTFYRTPLLRAIMVKHGDAAKRIWFSEFGAPTGTGRGAVTEARQAAIIADGFRLARTWSYAGPRFVFSGRDRGPDRGSIFQNFGFLRLNFGAKPALTSVRHAAHLR